MNSSNSKTSSSVKERKRTPMACMNCRERKLKCQPLESADSAPCERCIKERVLCQYRPVDSSSTSNNNASKYPNQDNSAPLTLYFPSAPTQEFPPPVDHPSYVATPGGYVPNPAFNPGVHAPFPTNLVYPTPVTPPYQPHPQSYPVPPYPNPHTEYPADQSYSQFSPQSFGHPDQFMPYPSAHGQGTQPYDHSYPFNSYENRDGCNSRKG